MRKFVGDMAYGVADGIGCNWLLRRFRDDEVAVLMYHGIASDASPIDAWTLVREGEFRRQMEYLRSRCEVLTIDQVVSGRSGTASQRGARRRKVVITFDDGYRSNFRLAFPILTELGLPATIFVATGFVGTQKTFWYDRVIYAIQRSRCRELDLRAWNLGTFQITAGGPAERWSDIQAALTAIKTQGFDGQQTIADHVGKALDAVLGEDDLFAPLERDDIATMHASGGVAFGSHTHRHEILTQASLQSARETIATSIAELQGILGERCRTFSYPNGDFSRELIDLLAQMHVDHAFTTEKAFWTRNTEAHSIPRLGIGGYDSMQRFAAMVSGLALAR
jgi:peptidoglycan/xylan/chitin deacetylase (PgdA/CDA1 family)